jgi:tartrate dehydrogenase/decarboxylase/D-malate dehydrogenase
MVREVPGVRVDKFHVDILAARCVCHPDKFDVVVASSLFSDILSDLGPLPGTIGVRRQPQSRPRLALALQTVPARRSAGHRQSDRPDRVRGNDAGPPGFDDRAWR